MNATNSYLEACRYLMGANVDDPGTWVDLHRLLGGVRLALTCCVCGRLLRSPMGQSPSVCHHHVCRDCVGGRMRYIKRGCGWCRNSEEFVANGQLECVVRCFRQLCRYLRTRASPVLSSLAVDAAVGGVLAIIQEAAAAVDEDDERKLGVARSPVKELDDLEKRSHSSQRKSEAFRSRKRIKIGRTFDDNESDKEICFNYKKVKHDPFSPLNADANCVSNVQPLDSVAAARGTFQSSCRLSANGHCSGKKSRDNRRLAFVADSSRDSQSKLNGVDSGCDSEKKPDNFILVEHDYNKCTADQTEADVVSTNWTPEEPSAVKQPTYSREQTEVGRRSKSSSREHAVDASVSSTVVSTTVIGTVPNSSGANHTCDLFSEKFKSKAKSGCRCALAAPNPGKLTCCGQRCPCYAAFKGCDSCKCRGCRNPRGDPRNIPASLLRAVSAPQTTVSTPRSGLNKISAPVT